MSKRYYWLKLKEDFFKDKYIKKLRKLAGGDTFTIIYLKMLLVAMQNEGELKYDGVEDNFAKEIALEIDEDPENVNICLQYLLTAGLAECNDTQCFVPYAVENVGSESDSAERVRRHREKMQSQTLHCNNDVTKALHCNTEKDIEKEIDRDIDTDTEKDINISPPISPPWDFNNHTNVANMKHLLEVGGDHEITDFYKRNIALKDCVIDWMEYKDARKPKNSNHYANDKSLLSLLKRIMTNCNTYGDVNVIDVIEESMSNNYQGIVWGKLEKAKKGSNNQSIDWSKI